MLCEGGGGKAGTARGEEVKNAGGSAMILMNDELDGFTTFAAEHVESCCWAENQSIY